MKDMTEKDLKKLVDKAEIGTVDHGKNKHVVVTIEALNRELRFPSAKDDADARQKAFDLIVNEKPHIRGFALDTDKE